MGLLLCFLLLFPFCSSFEKMVIYVEGRGSEKQCFLFHIYLFPCLSVFLSFYSFVRLPICLDVLSIYLPVCVSIHLFITRLLFVLLRYCYLFIY